jgi:hypothetical protein
MLYTNTRWLSTHTNKAVFDEYSCYRELINIHEILS